MALTLAESLREARSLPAFNGSSEYTLSNYLRDVATVLQLTPAEHVQTIQTVLSNRLQGKALKAVETLFNPTWEGIIVKLKEEFGVKRSFFNLRSDALNEEARNIEELHYKLSRILSLMNTKYSLEPDILYTPENNEKLIFDIYVNYLPISIKSLLLQNNIRSINIAYTFYLENNILKDIKLVNNKQANSFAHKSFQNNNDYPNNNTFPNNNFQNANNSLNRNGFQRFQNSSNFPNYSSRNNRNNSGGFNNCNRNFRNFQTQTFNTFNKNNQQQQTQNYDLENFSNLRQNQQNSYNRHLSNNEEPMEIDAIHVTENFPVQPRNYHYP